MPIYENYWACGIFHHNSGKSFWLAGYYLDLVKRGIGCTLIDPHGDLSRLVVALIAEHTPRALSDLIYLDFKRASDRGRYLPFNVLKQPGSRTVVAQNILQSFHRAWPSLANGNAPRFDKLTQNGVKALIGGGVPLPYLFRFLNNAEFRRSVLIREQDLELKEFFVEWFDKLPDRLRLDYIDSTVSRVNLLSFDEVLRYSLAHDTLAINFREMMDRGQHMVVNLAGLGSETERLIGSLFTVMMEQSALSREDSEERRTHVLIIDEFAKFSAKSEEALQTILSQTRKYGLFLVMAHQNWTQASERMRGAMGNARLKIAFQLDYPDAVRTAPEFVVVDPRTVSKREEATVVSVSVSDQITAMTQRLQRMPRRHALVRLPDDSIHEMVTNEIADPRVDTTAIEREQLERWFVPMGEQNLALPIEPLPVTRSKILR